MRRALYILALSFIGTHIASCSNSNQSTLGQLKYEADEEENIEFEKLNHEQVRNEYKELLDEFEDDKLKEQIERRIADVYMLEGEYDQKSDTQKSNYYLDAIKAYRNILTRFPNSPDNAEVLYQLAKAYDMEGQQDEAKDMLEELTTRHPYYANNGEAYFRLADIYFGRKRYKAAEQAYHAVTESGIEKLHLNAHYMKGWSQYKQSKFRTSALTFAFVLAEYLLENEDDSQLSKAQKSIVSDTIHSLSLSIDKIGGPESINALEGLANKPYVWLVYHALGEYYIEKELYESAASAYRYYLESNLLSLRAPNFHKKMIDTYTKGRFPRQALDEKAHYVENFGIYSKYYAKLGAQNTTLKNIKIFLDELARHHYSLGSAASKKLTELNALKSPKPKDIKYEQANELKSYRKAATYYTQYLETFPDDSRFDEVVFLQAEAYFISKQFDKSAQGYEFVAYTPKGDSAKKHASDAAYSAILSYQKHVETLKTGSDLQKEWQVNAIESMLRFSKIYHADERAPNVLTNAAEYLFSLDQYQRAIDIVNTLIQDNKKLDNALKRTAFGLLAHSHFKLENFLEAQSAYINQRNLVAKKSKDYQEISERLASTSYKYSEQLLTKKDTDAAISQLLNIKTLTPDSPVRIIAQYDAASLLLKAEKWDAAITELKQLLELFPKHELAEEFPRKLAFAYRKNEQFLPAAKAFLALHKNDPIKDIQREALFSAAEMFEQNMTYDTAIQHYKAYAYQYEEPFDARMEARYKLAINYTYIKEPGKTLYWLRRIIDGNKKAGAKQSERSQWLAAWAHSQYGDSFAKEFNRKKLTLPLIKSLSKKQEAMKNAINHYEKSTEFGHLEFITQSSVSIAELYIALSKAIRQSPKPKGLSAQDAATYSSILSEQAQPLEALAIELHTANAERAWAGEYNNWIETSFSQLKQLAPVRFAKEESIVSYGDEIR